MARKDAKSATSVTDANRSRSGLVTASQETIDSIFRSVGEKLRNGLSSEAEKTLWGALSKYRLSPDETAHVKRLLSFTLETVGRYKESLDVISPFADDEKLIDLKIETQVALKTRLAIAFNNVGEHPRAVTLLKESLEQATKHDLTRLCGNIDIGMSRVYRKLSEFSISRDHARRALANFREFGDWLGMAEAYRELAVSFNQEGNSIEAVSNFQQGIKIIGENSAPFMLGKLYTDMSGAYWFLRKPNEGIECLERSIEFFDQTEHALNSVIAYNNLGINLTHIGDWPRAESMIRRALEIGQRENHVHVAGIYDSLGELSIVLGDLKAAEEYLRTAVQIAEEREHKWYRLQSMRNLARCHFAAGDLKKAIEIADETIGFATAAGDKHYANMARLVLADAQRLTGDLAASIKTLDVIEDTDPSADMFVVGSIQRIRGCIALSDGDGDLELSAHHFSRALTIFEASHDLFHIGEMHQLLGSHVGPIDIKRARRHLASAIEIFRKLGRQDLVGQCEAAGIKLDKHTPRSKEPTRRGNSVISQLLTVRLAEATASRELLFRELISVLQQETNLQRMMIAQFDDQKRLLPFITHGYSTQDSNAKVAKLADAINKGDLANFSRVKNVSVVQLKNSVAEPAYLIMSPRSAAELNDGSPLQPLLRVVELCMEVVALRDRDNLRPADVDSLAMQANSIMPGFIHSSPAMTTLVDEVYKIRSSDVTVLVTGESGTGKELVSRAIHQLSDRKDRIFVPFNCTAVPKELAEGHLFGYKKGAFTGAVNDSQGVIRTADGGTLFLDEVGDLPLDVQPKLLRFLQEGEIQPLGEKRPLKVDVRIIAATNMPLEQKVADGTFREDLFYRLNVIRLRVPPLRERRAEIPPIVNYYINQYSDRFKKKGITFMPQTIDLLMVCNWEGNVRQLCNEIQRIVARAEDNEVITPDHISPDLSRSTKPLTPFGIGNAAKPIASFEGLVTPFASIADGITLEEAVSELEMQLIKASLSRNNWNISRVASELGLTRRGLYLKLARYGIEKAA